MCIRDSKGPVIIGVIGGPGTGKTTLCQVLKSYFEPGEYETISMDAYHFYNEYLDTHYDE